MDSPTKSPTKSPTPADHVPLASGVSAAVSGPFGKLYAAVIAAVAAVKARNTPEARRKLAELLRLAADLIQMPAAAAAASHAADVQGGADQDDRYLGACVGAIATVRAELMVYAGQPVGDPRDGDAADGKAAAAVTAAAFNPGELLALIELAMRVIETVRRLRGN